MRTAVLCAILAAAAIRPGIYGQDAAQQVRQATPRQTGSPDKATPADPNELAAPKPTPKPKLAGGAPVDDKTYVIGARDILQIFVYREPALSNNYYVAPDGKITMPFIGELAAAGKTRTELEKEISEALTSIVKSPVVTVGVGEVRSKRYFIMGEVLKPGDYELIVPTRIMEALVNAGGFKDFADQKNIIVNRDNGNEILKFNFKDVSKGKNVQQNVYLKPGDVIIVK